MPFTESLSVFFATADFATAATYKAGGTGAGTTINVIKDDAGLDHLGISGTHPFVLAKASDITSFSNSDTLTIGSTVYRLVDSQPLDDGALLRLQMEKQ